MANSFSTTVTSHFLLTATDGEPDLTGRFCGRVPLMPLHYPIPTYLRLSRTLSKLGMLRPVSWSMLSLVRTSGCCILLRERYVSNSISWGRRAGFLMKFPDSIRIWRRVWRGCSSKSGFLEAAPLTPESIHKRYSCLSSYFPFPLFFPVNLVESPVLLQS